LVKATIAMAHSLDLLVVSEGVEILEQLELLNELGCDLAQGYYFSKPIPAKELIEFQHTTTY
ncbi:MAG: EAL domain-containing protein, partial [Marinobacter sp.]|uniref:EAL domain-containing protein n=1 Tax=Marinobacter sp. TaxID=50741 RepID=UPI003F94E241